MIDFNDLQENWRKFRDTLFEVISRLLFGITSIEFLIYFGIGIVGTGGIGIWIDKAKGNDVSMDIFTFSMALIGIQILNAITAPKTNSALASIGALIGFIAIYKLGMGIYTESLNDLCWGAFWTLVLYFFIESNDEKYKSKTNRGPTGNNEPREEDLQDA